MIDKLKQSMEIIGVTIVIVVLILALPFLLAGTLVTASFQDKKRKEFLKRYELFLKENEGKEFFCYTNRKNSREVIEMEVLPKLDISIQVIRIDGKQPITSLDESYISHALYNIKNIGFPNVMKVVKGQLVDYSLHNEMYNAINSGRESELINIVASGFLKLRHTEKNEQSR
jgi:hypothetical protein